MTGKSYEIKCDDDFPIVIDTGASCSITPSPLDFDNDPVLPDFKELTDYYCIFVYSLSVFLIRTNLYLFISNEQI